MLNTLVIALILFTFVSQEAVFAAIKPVKIGVLAKRGVNEAYAKWAATAEYLNSGLPGYAFSVVPIDFVNLAQAVRRGEVDFVLTNDLHPKNCAT